MLAMMNSSIPIQRSPRPTVTSDAVNAIEVSANPARKNFLRADASAMAPRTGDRIATAIIETEIEIPQ
jgi:hypothetical protein